MHTVLKKRLRRTEAEVQDGKLTMAADGVATLSLKAVETQPLARYEPVAELVIRGQDFEATAPLTLIDVADLGEVLTEISTGEVYDDE